MSFNGWTQLATLTAEVNRLQRQGEAAKSRKDPEVERSASVALDRATSVRDGLLADLGEDAGNDGPA
jgi:hypothetical protein